MRFIPWSCSDRGEVGTCSMRFDQSAVREIHARIDIASFIGSYVSLRKRGNDLVGLCPFHSEKTPSFHVHPDKGFFKCFGCGVGGDVITFLSKLENLAFPDAVRMLAQKAGAELEPESPQTLRTRSDLRRQPHRRGAYRADAARAAGRSCARLLRPARHLASRDRKIPSGIRAGCLERAHGRLAA